MRVLNDVEISQTIGTNVTTSAPIMIRCITQFVFRKGVRRRCFAWLEVVTIVDALMLHSPPRAACESAGCFPCHYAAPGRRAAPQRHRSYQARDSSMRHSQGGDHPSERRF